MEQVKPGKTFFGSAEPAAGPARSPLMRRLSPFLALSLLLAACAGLGIQPPAVIPARDLAKLTVVAEALLHDDGYAKVDRLSTAGWFSPAEDAGGIHLRAMKDNANILSAAAKGGFNGFINNLFFNDKSSATESTQIDVYLLPRSGGHEVRVNAVLRHPGSKAPDETPYGYDNTAFSQRLMRAYGEPDLGQAAPVHPESLPLASPSLTPKPGQTASAPDPAAPASAKPSAPKRSSMLFGKPADEAAAP